MSIKVQAMGEYQTNCYIININDKDFIIDPGVESSSWIKQNVNNPVAILNTHGHFDHVWSNQIIQKHFNINLYCPINDAFMLEDDIFHKGMQTSIPDILVKEDEEFMIEGVRIKFHFFPGHTPGCSAIEIGENLFSGDFIFKGSIGRCDFPYSNPSDMKKSLEKVLSWNKDFKVFPGHGPSTTLEKEKRSLENWLNYI